MSGAQTLNCKRRYLALVEKWREEYGLKTEGKKLFNNDFAGILRISREHFQRLLTKEHIDIEPYENLLARYILWHYATKMGGDPTESLSVFEMERMHRLNMEILTNEDFVVNDAGRDYEKNPAPVKTPDLMMVRKQIDTAIVSLQEAMKTLPKPLGPEIGAAHDPAFRQPGKTKKAGKQ